MTLRRVLGSEYSKLGVRGGGGGGNEKEGQKRARYTITGAAEAPQNWSGYIKTPPTPPQEIINMQEKIDLLKYTRVIVQKQC